MKYIYALTDPRDNQVRYIGQTDDLAKRLQQHIADKSNSPKCTWIRELTTNRQYPGIVQLATVTDEENAHYIEYRWIYFGRKNGWNLTNTTAMKSEEYYSLQGYFERLIVEMEKPADVPVKQYSGEDVKQELLALTVKALKRLPTVGNTVGGAFSLASVNIAFCFVGILAALASSAIAGDSSTIGEIASTVSVFAIIISIFLLAGVGASGDLKNPEEKQEMLTLVNRGFRLVGFICVVASLFPPLLGGS